MAETWGAHGDGMRVQGVYKDREAAWDGLKAEVETLYVGGDGLLHGKPRNEDDWRRRRQWAVASPMKVQGRKQAPAPQGT